MTSFPEGPSSNLVVQLFPWHCLPLGVKARNIAVRPSQEISPSLSTLVKLCPATQRTEIPVKPVVVSEVKLLSGTPAETLRPLRAARD